MESRISRLAWRILFTSALVCFLAAAGLSQRKPAREVVVDDEDFYSPTPILLSEAKSTRALAQSPDDEGKAVLPLSNISSEAFDLNKRVVLYVTNLALMEGEGANAFRLYAVDKNNHTYRFPILDFRQDYENKGVYRLTALLTDEVGYFEPPVADGDVLIYVTWRGLASNQTRLGLGKIGGDIKEDPNARPTPLTTKGERVQPELQIVPRREADRARFLEQATFGPTRDYSTQFNRIKLKTWINNQFNAAYPTATNPYPNQQLKNFFAPSDCDGDNSGLNGNLVDVPLTCYRDTYTHYRLQTWSSLEMLYGTNQLRHRVSWALSQIWVTSGNTIQQSRQMVEWHKVLSNNAFGNYRNLMKQMTLNPTMGVYLSMAGSTRTNPNENYPREIAQLFSIGLFKMRPDGQYSCVEHDPCLPGDTKIATYDQNFVNNLTRVFTGWNLCSVSALCPAVSANPNSNNYIDPMMLNTNQSATANRHDLGSKTLSTYPGGPTLTIAACPPTGTGGCGVVCPAPGVTPTTCTLQSGFTNTTALAAIKTYADSSMDQAIDYLFNHPNLPPFVSRTLIQHLVTSDPSPAYVARVSAAFTNNGAGVRGDMKSVIMAILLDPEARGDVKTDPNYGKLREPVSFLYGTLRALNVRNAAGTGQSDGVFMTEYPDQSPNDFLGNFLSMGQYPYISPTVFNYFPPSYMVPGTSLNGPEFGLMTTGTSIQRANMINRICGFNTDGTLPASVPALIIAGVSTSTPNADVPVGTSIDISDLQTLAQADTTSTLLLDELNKRFMHYTMSASMRSTLQTAINTVPSTDPAHRVRQALYLLLTSSQYQVQR